MQPSSDHKKRILHLTTHVGGGIGTVVLNYLKEAEKSSDFTHTLYALGYTEKRSENLLKDIKSLYRDRMASQHNTILKEIEESDIVLIHWWNHPLIYDFLVRNTIPKCRLIIWSHVAGFHPPHVLTPKILNYPDIFTFTTPISLKAEAVKDLPALRKKRLRTVLGTGGVEDWIGLKHKKHSGFKIGYIGTVDYAKIHPNFLKICGDIKIPEAQFIVCGGSREKEIEKEAQKLGLSKKFKFTGRVNDIRPYLSSFDVFGYPLSPNHYGTNDQALIECMAAGVVPVVLSNKMEINMVKNGVTGLVARNIAEYVANIERLYKDKKLRKELSQNARNYSQKNFSLNRLHQDWERIFKQVLKLPKKTRVWSGFERKKILPRDIFIESLGKHGKEFTNHLTATSKKERTEAESRIREMGKLPWWESESKGTAHNYHLYFPKDKYLRLWSSLMKEIL